MNEEVQKTISQPVADDTIDDSALEEELNEILSRSIEEKLIPKEEKKEKINELEKKKSEEDEQNLLDRLNKLRLDPISSPEEEKDRLTPELKI